MNNSEKDANSSRGVGRAGSVGVLGQMQLPAQIGQKIGGVLADMT